MRFIPIVLILAGILGGNLYVFYRLWHLMPYSLIGRFLFIVIACILISSPFISMGLGGHLPTGITSFLYKIGTSWLILFMYLLLFFLFCDLIRVTHLFPIEKFMYANGSGLGVILICACLLLGSGYYRYLHKDRVELTLPLNKTMTTQGELKIVAISDLHLGYSIGKEEFKGWVDLINQENPDLVLIAGDITDNNIKPLYEQDMAAVFKEIKSKYGTYAILGNHEYIADPVNASAFLESAGVTLLRDSVACVDHRFYIIGRDDRSNSQRKTMEALTASLDPSLPILLLDHQPYHLEEAEKYKIDFQFSGHTHNGQVWPINWVTQALFEKAHGYLKKGDSHFYISSGLGIWGGKFRIGTRSEYVVVTIKGNTPS
ncbi:putative MPP superfamily phosphohydrolase [Parabacteroides sp. PM5-20]|uniref:metallophosphoesterase n=1 Tax=Parabacteroides sp. PM5-20 TaxID=2940527 RepID=UPI0024759EC3|nr:metallophosphoesterase [Parabacteroides sp. PM5-20]MDH6534876.1 putative MPP superfamily phosphohydrolase [Parabacteroides sp. PM5-20]